MMSDPTRPDPAQCMRHGDVHREHYPCTCQPAPRPDPAAVDALARIIDPEPYRGHNTPGWMWERKRDAEIRARRLLSPENVPALLDALVANGTLAEERRSWMKPFSPTEGGTGRKTVIGRRLVTSWEVQP